LTDPPFAVVWIVVARAFSLSGPVKSMIVDNHTRTKFSPERGHAEIEEEQAAIRRVWCHPSRLLTSSHERVAATRTGEETSVAVERIKSEVTGKVWKLTAAPGDRVEAEQTIMLIESMKMEIPVMVPSGGVLASVLVEEGQDITEGQEVATVEI
jgi:acetyl-CoA carboxylase biotin carboxyl carrier protein